MKYTKRFLALFLALCMMLTSVPMDARAAESTQSEVMAEDAAQNDEQAVTEDETSETVNSDNTESTEKDGDAAAGADQSDSATDEDSQDTTLDDAKPGKDKPDNAKPGKDKPENSKPGKEKPDNAKPGKEKPDNVKPGKDEKENVKPGKEKPDNAKPGKDEKENVKPEKEKPGKDEKTEVEDAQESKVMLAVPERSTEDALSVALAEAKPDEPSLIQKTVTGIKVAVPAPAIGIKTVVTGSGAANAGCKATPYNISSVENGDKVWFTAIVAEGYSFVGWYLGDELQSADESYEATISYAGTTPTILEYEARFAVV